MEPLQEAHIAEPGLLVIDVAGADDAIVMAFQNAVARTWGRVLRRVVLLESAVPLLVVAVVAIGMGFLAAQLFVQAQFRYSIQAPGIQYYAIVLAGLVASLGVIASTVPLLRRITGPETARND
ncbi:DUF6207 family protein [Streptomyces sp. NPDC001663]|uniref:DUF6207 family protein n=1 Tax=Streptomyces sp. NPDC001663 TaxID=3364597 RepID=UPI0036904814